MRFGVWFASIKKGRHGFGSHDSQKGSHMLCLQKNPNICTSEGKKTDTSLLCIRNRETLVWFE